MFSFFKQIDENAFMKLLTVVETMEYTSLIGIYFHHRIFIQHIDNQPLSSSLQSKTGQKFRPENRRLYIFRRGEDSTICLSEAGEQGATYVQMCP